MRVPPITNPWIARSIVVTQATLVPLITWSYFRLYGGMKTMDAAVLLSSLAYQLYALPWEIWRNWKMKAVNKVSYGMAFCGTASYAFSTIRALIQPDWVDVGSRWWGMVGSLIIAGQIVIYDRVRLSWDFPVLIKPAFNLHAWPELAKHTTSWWCKGCIEVSGLVWRLPLEIRCDKCGGPVHLLEQRIWQPEVDPDWECPEYPPQLFRCRCARCHAEYLKRTPGPYPIFSTYWLWDKAGWQEVDYDTYKDEVGTSSYVALPGRRGVVAKPAASPVRLVPGLDDLKIVGLRSAKLH